MDTKKGTILTPFVTDPHWGGAPLYALLFLIARYTNSEFQSLRTCFLFRKLPFNHILFSPSPTFATRDLSAGFVADLGVVHIPLGSLAKERSFSRPFL
jgi:hypothetical protein